MTSEQNDQATPEPTADETMTNGPDTPVESEPAAESAAPSEPDTPPAADPPATAEPTPKDVEPAPVAPEDAVDDAAGREEFAAMLDASGAGAPADAKAGDKVSGTIVQMDGIDAFVDCGLRNEVPMSVEELKNEAGEVTHKVGDKVTGHLVKAKEGGLKLVLAINQRDVDRQVLADAHAAGTPITGKVGETNKGGFSVHIGKVRAFCPFSQIDLRRADDPTIFVGKSYQFKILELSPDGRNVVVSRRAFLQENREAEADKTRASLKLGDDIEGTVTRLVPFGAFVDIGGVEGLVHISQISHQRVGSPAEVLNDGQQVRVKVLEIQNLGQGRSERISLSIKALATDPWPETAASLTPQTDTTGIVTRLVDFGVFVELQPGVEGLIHISELANRRISHPREVVNENDEISVRILDVDLGRRRISLSRKEAADYEGD